MTAFTITLIIVLHVTVLGGLLLFLKHRDGRIDDSADNELQETPL